MERDTGTAAILAAGVVHQQRTSGDLVAELTRALRETNSGLGPIIAGFAQLAAGKGRLSPNDFIDLRLFDKDFIGGNDPREFVGGQQFGNIIRTVNWQREWIAMLSDKVASTAYLQAYGIPTIPIKAIYRRDAAVGRPGIIGTTPALEDFLLHQDQYPLFGKPTGSQNSLGSVALSGCDTESREVILSDGSRVSVSALAAEIDAKYPDGYILQQFAKPHPAIAALCGERIACVRMLTILTKDGPRVVRACWKIPAGAHMADNYWRNGNLLAQIDHDGRVQRVTSGTGLEMREYDEHPDTKAKLIGFEHPQWSEMESLALEGAALMHHVPLIGWDIACTKDGPSIIEMNEYPDAFVMQFADRRGLLDETFESFLAFQKEMRGNKNA